MSLEKRLERKQSDNDKLLTLIKASRYVVTAIYSGDRDKCKYPAVNHNVLDKYDCRFCTALDDLTAAFEAIDEEGSK